jgi:hypothetical protein
MDKSTWLHNNCAIKWKFCTSEQVTIVMITVMARHILYWERESCVVITLHHITLKWKESRQVTYFTKDKNIWTPEQVTIEIITVTARHIFHQREVSLNSWATEKLAVSDRTLMRIVFASFRLRSRFSSSETYFPARILKLRSLVTACSSKRSTCFLHFY